MASSSLSRRDFAALLTLGVAGTASAQPAGRPVRIVVGFAPGGGADSMMRVLAQQLQQQLGQTVILDNRPGADGVIAADAVAHAAPDGTTLFFASNGPMVALPILRKGTVPYDPFKNFTPVGLMGRFTMVLVTGPSVTAKDFREFVQQARSSAGAMNFGTANSVARMAAIQFMAQTKTDFGHVPYKGDSAGLVDLMSGRIQMMFPTVAAVRALLKEGRVHPLLVIGDNRSPVMPDVPTSKEAGVRITVSPWAGLYAPANTPAATVERLNVALRASLGTADVREQMDKLGFEPAPSSPAEMAALHRAEYNLFDKTVNQDGVKFD